MIIESRFEVAGCPGFADTAHGVVGLRRPRLGRLEEDAVCAESGTTRGNAPVAAGASGPPSRTDNCPGHAVVQEQPRSTFLASRTESRTRRV
ncbi:hypothetical protein GCM10010095_82900 [Streptomyces anthocyanicus]|nr:hypothetical protein JCM4020_02300 [Streptomyces coelicolor]GGL85533.1 hypothetical protein GCM10010095_82900 [Streptomyces anthocyanicus]GHA29044.1 hypothetical protein GCM10010391_11460 [Streptomyces anthocyanicus]GHB88277.1 hypothetical protein GCM10010348_01660 [Streptomyces anthocyanicus]